MSISPTLGGKLLSIPGQFPCIAREWGSGGHGYWQVQVWNKTYNYYYSWMAIIYILYTLDDELSFWRIFNSAMTILEYCSSTPYLSFIVVWEGRDCQHVYWSRKNISCDICRRVIWMNTCSIEYPSNCSGTRILTLEFCRNAYSLNYVLRRDSETWTWNIIF